jgi:hypothetical protein
MVLVKVAPHFYVARSQPAGVSQSLCDVTPNVLRTAHDVPELAPIMIGQPSPCNDVLIDDSSSKRFSLYSVRLKACAHPRPNKALTRKVIAGI